MYNQLLMLNGGISVIKSIGIIDIILVIFIFFLAVITVADIFLRNNIFGNIIFGLIVYFTTLYFYKIDDGFYLAETVERNGKKIGKGIETKYNFDIVNNKYININKKYRNEIKFIFNRNKSNFIIKTYQVKNTKFTITMSLTGTVYWHKENGKIGLKTKVYN